MKGPRSLKALIAGWTPRPGRGESAHADQASAAFAAAWEEAVGAQIAARSRPAKFRNGVLTVLTASSAWSDELSQLAPRIITALQRAFPDERLHKLRFMVASGRTKLLLDGERFRARVVTKRRSQPSPTRSTSSESAGGDDLATTLARIATLKKQLNAERDRSGWKICPSCERRFLPESQSIALCAPCAESKRRATAASIERALMQAPWLSFTDVRRTLPAITFPAFDRAKQRLLGRWQSEIESAQRRLRRDSITAEDRVVAWSYLMLSTGLAQRDIGRAVVTDVLGRDWMIVLFGDSATQNQEARRARRENQK
jgi:Dna[CI] antecedent, DciA